jgi:putative transposase
MTEGLHRFYGENDLHFLTFSCYRRQPFFSSPARCDLFLQILERVRRPYRLVILSYVVMPEHIHLLVSEPQRENLSVVIQALKLGFVRSLERDHSNLIPRSRKNGETWGTPVNSTPVNSTPVNSTPVNPKRFWQARFYDFNVWTERKRVEKLRYIHRNPVKRGLVESPDQWRWSSFRCYSRGEPGPVRINDTEILVMRIHPPAA